MKKKYITKEKHYDILFEREKKNGLNKLGIMTSFGWDNDPKRLTFVLSRYKFVSKMLTGKKDVLEIGSCDGWASRIVKQTVGKLTCSDFDPEFIKFAKKNSSKKYQIKFMLHDMVKKCTANKYDAIYAIDVFEHIKKSNERKFINNIKNSLKANGVLILGIPSLESQKYAKDSAKKGHVNCKSGNEFRKIMSKYFDNVFLFSMNDEVIHTGFESMSHYLFVICTDKN
tara:strand:+ start:15540 stop:16220 length:681 start_codon:yes stop_codon:yes gene_type:complete